MAGSEDDESQHASSVRVYEAIRQRAVDFELRPEERINEYQLAFEFGISRTPVREALNRLTAEGFLFFERNRGFFFRALNIDEIVQFFQLRAIIEKGAFELACARVSDDEATAFVDKVEDMFRDQDSFSSADALSRDEEFHIALSRLSGNDAVVNQLDSLNARIRFARHIKIAHGALQKAMADDHVTIARYLAKRDVSAGTSLLDKHIEMTVADARTALQEVLLKSYEVARRPAAPPAKRKRA